MIGMWWEGLIVGAIVAAAGAYVGRLLYRKFRLRGPCGPCGPCGATRRRAGTSSDSELYQISISSTRKTDE